MLDGEVIEEVMKDESTEKIYQDESEVDEEDEGD